MNVTFTFVASLVTVVTFNTEPPWKGFVPAVISAPFVMPSPNIPTLDSAVVYPGTVLFEGTNASEGRGTTRPFELVGAPWVDAEALARSLERYNALARSGEDSDFGKAARSLKPIGEPPYYAAEVRRALAVDQRRDRQRADQLAYRDSRRHLGGYIDPLADKALLVSVFITLGHEGYISSWLVIMVVFRDVMIVSGAVLYHLLFGNLTMEPLLSSKLNTAAFDDPLR